MTHDEIAEIAIGALMSQRNALDEKIKTIKLTMNGNGAAATNTADIVPMEVGTIVVEEIDEAPAPPKKIHWTQTAAGRAKMAASQKRAWKTRKRK